MHQIEEFRQLRNLVSLPASLVYVVCSLAHIRKVVPDAVAQCAGPVISKKQGYLDKEREVRLRYLYW